MQKMLSDLPMMVWALGYTSMFFPLFCITESIPLSMLLAIFFTAASGVTGRKLAEWNIERMERQEKVRKAG